MTKTKLPRGWQYPKSSEIFDCVSDKSHGGRLQVLSATQDRGIVPRTEMDIDIKFDEKSLPTYKRVVPGNFVIHLRSFQGGLAYSDVEGIISPAYTILKPKIEICDYYYKSLFQSADYIKKLNSAVYGIRDGKQISYDTFGVIRIPLPPLPEQRAIADVLTTADKLIAAKVRKIAALRKRKRWIMQNLMTGEKRVSGFCGKWERAKLGERITLQRGYDLPKDNMCNGKYPVVGSNGIIGYHDKYTTEAPSITVGRSGSVGKVLILNERTWSHNTALYVKNSTNIDNYYLYYLLSFLKLDNYAGKSAVPTLNRNDVHSIEIDFPTITEQKAIANVLITADKEIELLVRDLDKHKQIKKYLMQKLLTGKIRVGAGGKK